MKIDAHQHFWNYDPVRDGWIDNSMSVLKRDFLPDELKTLLTTRGIDGCVAVQADQSEEETKFLLSLANQNPFILGVVGWVDLQAPNINSRLAHFSENHLFKGVRHILQGEPNDDFMLSGTFLRGIEALAKHNLTYDLLILPKHLRVALELVKKFPEQPFVIDHLAKPLIKDFKFNPWQDDIVALAEHPNVFCKVSGLITEADWDKWNQIDINPYLDVVFDAFSTDRLMFGSDWPVCNLAGNYTSVCSLLTEYMKPFTREDKSKVWGDNAMKFYNLNQWSIWKNEAS